MTGRSNRKTGQGRRRAAPGRGLASLQPRHWAVLIGAVAVVVAVVLLLFPRGSAPGTAQLQIGDCFDVPKSTDITGVAPVPCTGLHTGELFARVTAPQSATYPLDEDFHDAVFNLCGPEFARYTGLQPGLGSSLTFSAFWPTVAGWNSGDRAVHCFLTSLNGTPLTKSYRAA